MAHYRNPNGYGSVVKLSGNRRRPYVARKTVGWDDRAYPIYAVIGYYPTRKDAMIALAEYNADPYDIDLSKVTLADLYKIWSEHNFPKMKTSLKNAYATAYKHCSSLYDVQYGKLRKFQMQQVIDNCGLGYSSKQNIKLLFSQLDKYAFDQDIIKKCYSSNLEIGTKPKSEKHKPFTDHEVQLLWQHQGEKCIDEALFMLYTGCRLSEMLGMRCSNVDIKNGVMVGGVKSLYGINRTIPIHHTILPVIQSHLSDSEYLFLSDRKSNADDNIDTALRSTFSRNWTLKMKELGINHKTHDCRHTVRSKLDSAGANKVAIDRIMGHSSSSIGERVYTHKTVKELQEAMEMLSYESANG